MTSTLYHGNACNTARNGYAMVLLPSNNRSLTILAGRICTESVAGAEITGFSRENLRWTQQLAE